MHGFNYLQNFTCTQGFTTQHILHITSQVMLPTRPQRGSPWIIHSMTLCFPFPPRRHIKFGGIRCFARNETCYIIKFNYMGSAWVEGMVVRVCWVKVKGNEIMDSWKMHFNLCAFCMIFIAVSLDVYTHSGTLHERELTKVHPEKLFKSVLKIFMLPNACWFHNDLIKRNARSPGASEFLKEQTNDPLKFHVCTCFMRGNLHKTPWNENPFCVYRLAFACFKN